MVFSSFSPEKPVFSKNLSSSAIFLEDWILVNVTGQDSERYLQGQITADIKEISHNQHLLTAHCNPRGKMWTCIRLFRRHEGFSFILRRSVSDIQLTEIKKYATFSKVTFSIDNNYLLLGIAGFKARIVMESIFNEIPNANESLIHKKNSSILWIEYPSDRFIVITNKKYAQNIIYNLQNKKVLFNHSQQWLALNIEAGIPIIDLSNSGKFMPQETNLQFFGGISFKKGCYIGQEAIARAKYRGINKLSICCLLGTSNRLPKIGEKLELRTEEHWKRTGTVLAAVELENNCLLVQAVIKKDLMNKNSVFRICNDKYNLKIIPLPYFSLKE